MNVLRNPLTVCGEVLVSFLGDGSRDLGRIAIVGSTFQAGVISSVGKLRVGGVCFSCWGRCVTGVYPESWRSTRVR